MAEANASLHLTQLRASMALATNVRATQVALNAAASLPGPREYPEHHPLHCLGGGGSRGFGSQLES